MASIDETAKYLTMLMAGFLVIFLGLALLLLGQAAQRGAEFRGIGIVLIGPFPLLLDTSNPALAIAAVATLLLVSILFIYIVARRVRG